MVIIMQSLYDSHFKDVWRKAKIKVFISKEDINYLTENMPKSKSGIYLFMIYLCT